MSEKQNVSEMVWESILHHFPGMPVVKELYKVIPSPDSPRIKRLLVLRCLENRLINFGIDSHTYSQLNLLKKLSENPEITEDNNDSEITSFKDDTSPSDLLLLSTARELAVVHMRNDDWPSFDEVVKQHWQGGIAADEESEGVDLFAQGMFSSQDDPETEGGKPIEEELGSKILKPLRHTKRDILEVHKDFNLRLQIAKKYPEEPLWEMLEEYLCRVWDLEKKRFVAQTLQCEFYTKGIRKAHLELAQGGGDEVEKSRISARAVAITGTIIPCSKEKEAEEEGGKGEKKHPGDGDHFPLTPGTLAEIQLLKKTLLGTKRKHIDGHGSEAEHEEAREDSALGGENENGEESSESAGAMNFADQLNNVQTQPSNAEEETMEEVPLKEKNSNLHEAPPKAGQPVATVLGSLRSASARLKKLGKDPLPEAMFVAQKVGFEENDEISDSESDEQSREPPEPLSKGRDAAEQGEKGQSGEAGQRSEGAEGSLSRRATLRPRRNLMERQSTAQLLDWESEDEDEDEAVANRKRPGRPQLRRVAVDRAYGPLMTGGGEDSLQRKANVVPRRRNSTPWSEEETMALVEGVKRHGTKWKLIFLENEVLFTGRTLVDLKDKWRNIEKFGHKLAKK